MTETRDLALERVARLRKFLELRAPGNVTVLGLQSVLRSLLLLHPADTGRMLGELLVEGTRLHVGLCPHCGIGKYRSDISMCTECGEAVAKEDAEITFEDDEPKGGVS